MVNISGYQNAISGLYGNEMTRAKPTRDGEKVQKTQVTPEKAEAAESKLSAKAQDFLKNLREANDDMDFFIGNSDSDVADALGSSEKEYSVVFSAEEIEKMANDEEYARKKLDSVTDAMDMADSIAEQYDFEGNGIKAKIGITFDDEGNTRIFAELEKLSDKQKERIDEARKDRTEDMRKGRGYGEYGAKKEATIKRTTLTATGEDELIEKLQKLDWSKITEEIPYTAGGRINLTA